MGLLLGYDIGSSSVKASVLDAESGKLVCSAISPSQEMEIISQKAGWAEQDPASWWDNLVLATQEIVSKGKVQVDQIKAIGISYQMHGLVVVDKNQNVLRPSIIWCDGRATDIGKRAFQDLGEKTCLSHYLNAPGNFTASKLKWVMENEPDIFERIHKIMLPGDYIAMKMTGRIATTVSGLSEGILWDYTENKLADKLMNYYGFSGNLIPEVINSFDVHGTLTTQAAKELGLIHGIPIAYRAGDQPNNALSLNVMNPGEVAATAGTSGVIYTVTDQAVYDEESRVNTFVHVNHSTDLPRYGVLQCINGTGILYSWLKRNMDFDGMLTYDQMNKMAEEVPVGSDKLCILPFGNGPERVLGNKEIQACFLGLNFNRHTRDHMLRAAQEGIIFALNYGLQILNNMGIKLDLVKAGHANMFLSPLFRESFVNTIGSQLELYDTDGAQGAARGAGIGAKIFTQEEAFTGLTKLFVVEPDHHMRAMYHEAYEYWHEKLKSELQI